MDEITPNNEADAGSNGAASGKADTAAGTGASTAAGTGASAMTDNLIITRPRAPAAFDLQSEFKPAGDQPSAIAELIAGPGAKMPKKKRVYGFNG